MLSNSGLQQTRARWRSPRTAETGAIRVINEYPERFRSLRDGQVA
jgi:hypothetical protein